MPTQSLIASTNLPDVHFGGRLATSFTMPWDPLIPTQDNPYRYALTTLDEGPGGKVQFVTTAEVTGQSVTDISETAMCRILCIYIVMRLSEKYLKDACHAL